MALLTNSAAARQKIIDEKLLLLEETDRLLAAVKLLSDTTAKAVSQFAVVGCSDFRFAGEQMDAAWRALRQAREALS